MSDMTYEQKLKDLRQERGLSQADIALLLNTSQQYYGKYESGAIVALLSVEGYFDMITYENIEDFTFRYPNQNHIQVFYNGYFYSLTKAYQNGYLTYDDIAAIYEIHTTR